MAERKRQYPKVCVFCGAEYLAKMQKSMYCSEQCKRDADKKRKFDRYPTRNKTCEFCGNKLPKNFSKYCSEKCRSIAEQGCLTHSEPVKRICVKCGKEFIGSTRQQNQIYCSRRCLQNVRSKTREFRKRTSEMAEFDSSISLNSVYQKDNGKCYICGKICNKNDKKIVIGKDGKPHSVCGGAYPSIDHVIPLAKGGSHSWNNVRLACVLCNRTKSDRDLLEVI